MNLNESIRVSLASIAGSKLRSALTLLGVVIGVMTIIATMSIIRGLNNLMESEMSELASGVFQVQRYAIQMGIHTGHHRREYRPNLGMTETRAIERNVPTARYVAPEVHKWQGVIKHQNDATNPNNTIFGAVPASAPNNGWSIASGRFLSEPDVQYARPVIVLGAAVVKKLFPLRDPVGKMVTVNGQRVEVIGTLTERGSMLNQNADNIVVVPITSFTRWWGFERSWVITVQAEDPSKIDKTIEQTTIAMRSARGLKPGEENNFAIWHSNQLVDSFNQMTAWIGIAAFGIASIALLVAGIGIMNIMLVTVTERTREIGVRKAIGARRSSILGQFLLEAIILTEIGAFIGVVVGIGAAYLLGGAADLPIAVPIWSIVIGIVFCSVIGLAFGTWPAWKASRLDPIEALRYE
jgi:putative ABC transport system permease protein